jgi:hypothetical protein
MRPFDAFSLDGSSVSTRLSVRSVRSKSSPIDRKIMQLEALRLADHRPTIRFNAGPGYRSLPDGTHEPMWDIVHTWTPTHV